MCNRIYVNIYQIVILKAGSIESQSKESLGQSVKQFTAEASSFLFVMILYDNFLHRSLSNRHGAPCILDERTFIVIVVVFHFVLPGKFEGQEERNAALRFGDVTMCPRS